VAQSATHADHKCSEQLAKSASRLVLLMCGATVGAINGAIGMLTRWPLFDWQESIVRLLSDRGRLMSDITHPNGYARP
jgi:hypothetical protein